MGHPYHSYVTMPDGKVDCRTLATGCHSSVTHIAAQAQWLSGPFVHVQPWSRSPGELGVSENFRENVNQLLQLCTRNNLRVQLQIAKMVPNRPQNLPISGKRHPYIIRLPTNNFVLRGYDKIRMSCSRYD